MLKPRLTQQKNAKNVTAGIHVHACSWADHMNTLKSGFLKLDLLSWWSPWDNICKNVLYNTEDCIIVHMNSESQILFFTVWVKLPCYSMPKLQIIRYKYYKVVLQCEFSFQSTDSMWDTAASLLSVGSVSQPHPIRLRLNTHLHQRRLLSWQSLNLPQRHRSGCGHRRITLLTPEGFMTYDSEVKTSNDSDGARRPLPAAI